MLTPPPLGDGSNLPPHIATASDLVTSKEATRDGFLLQAIAKSSGKAVPYVDKAKALMSALRAGGSLDSLLSDPTYRNELISAAGLSDKARKYFTPNELDERAKEVLSSVVSTSGATWVEEIVYRYLLTKGDTLGGEMRNWVGMNAQRQLSAALKNFLPPQGVVETIDTDSGKLRRVDWGERRIYFDVKAQLLGNNIDVVLVNTASQVISLSSARNVLEVPDAYLACGELKGGIDPAGADEHWKTAKTALERIRTRFHNLDQAVPNLFFVGAAIQKRMADDIFDYLGDGTLDYAANLTVPEQVADLAQWLVNL